MNIDTIERLTHRRPAMSDDLILQLALQAMHDEDALPDARTPSGDRGDATPAKWVWEEPAPADMSRAIDVSSHPCAVAAVPFLRRLAHVVAAGGAVPRNRVNRAGAGAEDPAKCPRHRHR